MWASSSVSHKAARGSAGDMQREADYTAASLKNNYTKNVSYSTIRSDEQWKTKCRL